MLTEQETTSYQQQGFVVPQFRLPDQHVARLREALDRVIESNPGTRPEQLVSVHINAAIPGRSVSSRILGLSGA